MPMIMRLLALLLGCTPLLLVGGAEAQDRLVTVQLSQVQMALAAQMGLAASIIPSKAELSLPDAAKACGKDPAELKEDPAACTAVGATQELQAAVLEMIANGDTPAPSDGR